MPEVTIKYKNAKTLDTLLGLAKYLDFVVEKKYSQKKSKNEQKKDLPISFASNPDVTALAGIWKNKEVSLKGLREKAWGARL